MILKYFCSIIYLEIHVLIKQSRKQNVDFFNASALAYRSGQCKWKDQCLVGFLLFCFAGVKLSAAAGFCHSALNDAFLTVASEEYSALLRSLN